MKVTRETWAALNQPEGAIAGTVEDLRASGIGGFQFTVGDTVEFPIWDDLLVIKTKVKGTNALAVQVGVVLNEKPRFIPVGSFRRRPHNWVDYEEKLGDLNVELLQLPTDWERLQLLAGKKIQVGDLEKLKFPVFKDGQPSYENNKQVLTEKSCPIFKWA